jgi:hypothetical protein
MLGNSAGCAGAEQATKAVRPPAKALGARVLGGEADFAAAGWEWHILVCFLLGSATDREFLGAEFQSIDRTPGCCFLALYCIYLILSPSINHEADRDRLWWLDWVNYH